MPTMTQVRSILPDRLKRARFTTIAKDPSYRRYFAAGDSTLTLFLTDARNRPLGRQAGSASGTAAGSQTVGVLNSNLQSTQGNLFFTATIRIDVVQASFPQRLQAPPPMLSQPPLNNRGTLIWQDHGTSKYDTA